MNRSEPIGLRVPCAVPAPMSRYSPLRLVLIPLLLYIIWVLDTFLLEGSSGVFLRYQPLNLLVYTLVANVFMGTIVPVICLRPAFMSGAVNMFQVGFRSLRRTLLTVSATALSGYLILVTFTPFGSLRTAVVGPVALMLPVAVAEVMICWVLVGTHLQAYVRRYGATVSILTGVLVTSLLFGLSSLALSPTPVQPPAVLPFILVGLGTGLFFFSLRDVYASVIFAAFGLALVMLGKTDPLYSDPISPFVAGAAAFSVLALAASQWYLSRHFITIRLPVETGSSLQKKMI